MVDIFSWDENFNTGIEVIDAQHYQLVLILNRLAMNIASESNRDELNAIFEELIDYTLYHFKTEESIWHKYLPDNPLEMEHQAIHEEFVNKVLHLKSQLYISSFDTLAKV